MALAMEQRPPISFGREATTLTLDELLGEARDSFAAELVIPLTVERPPELYSIGSDGQRIYEAAEGAQIGLSMSAQMHRRIGHPADDYGNVFPVARALHDLRGWCRGRHLDTRAGPWIDHKADVAIGPTLQRPLCARLAWYAVVWHMQPAWSARQEKLAMPIVRRLLHAALKHMWEQRRDWAHADDSGVGEVLAQQRRERREARRRAEAATAPGVVCRYCGRPYDVASQEPCSQLEGDPEGTIYGDLGFTFLCAPADPS